MLDESSSMVPSMPRMLGGVCARRRLSPLTIEAWTYEALRYRCPPCPSGAAMVMTASMGFLSSRVPSLTATGVARLPELRPSKAKSRPSRDGPERSVDDCRMMDATWPVWCWPPGMALLHACRE
ncbi:hypothetical protein GLOTRDRAFT_109154 [Gloeophyllum trabeum ATCC 11539]|uniref:Uncharacterized protein n=1 Tax=Gloeophyllum trabeum (strain ATCC 11539 / FP-39264 / Madison 617) TaxID=670483 RepID=S7QN20_GLOTA|nr:uncharacterized protein GLOTRDRAFT_109154 [Gloeophyllum trabeum ATCC 11539]EPQ60812.1 hypothetical protein GLOTRDRAFT_109154 [Gloeophyllum trabeum ATCC 11539]